MQTICSWFKKQNYTTKSIPSHREIQQMLVEMGDKQKNFIGSKEWIGAFEINLCLQEFWGV